MKFDSGFTLIELIITLGMAAILMLLSSVYNSAGSKTTKANQVVADVRGLLVSARNQARNLDRCVVVTVDQIHRQITATTYTQMTAAFGSVCRIPTSHDSADSNPIQVNLPSYVQISDFSGGSPLIFNQHQGIMIGPTMNTTQTVNLDITAFNLPKKTITIYPLLGHISNL